MQHCRYSIRDIVDIMSKRNASATNEAMCNNFLTHAKDCAHCTAKLETLKQALLQSRKPKVCKPTFPKEGVHK